MSDTELVSLDPRGRKPSRQRHAGAVSEAEDKFARVLPDIADHILSLAIGTDEQKCAQHGHIFQCPDCDKKAKPIPKNFQALIYVMNRIAGSPAIKGEQQVNMAFVQKAAKAVAMLFNDVNELADPDERARKFAIGITQLYALMEME